MISVFFPENVIGYHSNMCGAMSTASSFKGMIGSLWPSLFIPKEYIDFHYPFGEIVSFIMEESGYMHLQATKPDTIGNYQFD